MKPQSTETKKMPIWGWVVLGIIIIWIIGKIGGSGDNEKVVKKEEAPREVVYNSSWDASVRQVERYLKSTLKDPDSYEGIDWSEVKKIDGQKHRFIVRHKYRAKNSFGGFVIDNQIFFLDSEGVVIDVQKYPG